MTLLEDEPFDEAKWANGYTCEFPGVKVTVAANKHFAEQHPDVVGF